MGHLQRVIGGSGHVGRNADAFPVGAGDRVDRPAIGDPQLELQVVTADELHRVPATSRGFTDHRRPSQRLQVVGELLRGGEGRSAGEHVEVGRRQSASSHVVRGPRLYDPVLRPLVPAVDVRRLVEEVAEQQPDHPGVPAAVVAQIDDDGVRVRQELQRRDGGGTRRGRIIEAVEPQIPDVPVQDLHLLEHEVGVLQVLQPCITAPGFLLWIRSDGTRRRLRSVLQPDVTVTGDGLEVVGDRLNEEADVGEPVPRSALAVLSQGGYHAVRDLRKHIGVLETGRDPVDDGRTFRGADRAVGDRGTPLCDGGVAPGAGGKCHKRDAAETDAGLHAPFLAVVVVTRVRSAGSGSTSWSGAPR